MQKIINGIDNFLHILEEVNCKKLFLVVDSSYPFISIKDDVEALSVEKVKFDKFTPNPLYEQVCEGLDLFLAEECDAILAVGGGSAIDVAKCIKLAALAEEGKAVVIPPLVSKRLPIDGNKIPFIAIPTTAGTGSESTHNAVMYYEGAKQTVTNDAILPDYAVLESSALKTLPLYQKKCTMMDALCQGIESWWSVNATDESRGYSRNAIELIMANWRKYIFEEYTPGVALRIMEGANYAGKAINISATTAAHAMSYKITSLYKLPHGHAVAVCLPEVWEYMLANPDKCIHPLGKDAMLRFFDEIAAAMGASSPCKAIAFFRQMMKDMDLQNPMSGDRESELSLLSKSVNQVRLKNNPVVIDEAQARKLYETIVK